VKPATLRKQRQRAREAAVREVEFVREDWTLFLHPDRLQQKAGCSRDHMRAMVLKELVDNALDAGPVATLARSDADTWVVTDDGAGLDRDRVLRFFAVKRPLTSTKLLRRPTRGAIGNGLRVVTGGAIASGGKLTVESRGGRYVLDVDRATGATVVVEVGGSEVVTGTRVTVAFGPALPRGRGDGWMARIASRCHGPTASPMLSHPAWYTQHAFAEMVQAAEPGTTAADIAALMGVEPDADEAVRPPVEADFHGLRYRAGPQPVLLPLGADRFPGCYAKEIEEPAEDTLGGTPVLVEAWAQAERRPRSRGRGTVTVLVNRSPVATSVRLVPGGDHLVAFGCNLTHCIERVPADGAYEVVLAVTSPTVPITTEGKEPDLRPLWDAIVPVLAKAMRAAHKATRPSLRRGGIKSAAHEVMEEAYLKASADGTLPANARQIYYAARPLMQELLGAGAEIKDQYFTQYLLPDFMAAEPGLTEDWGVVYDARGHLLEPHTGTTVPVGTAQAREYLMQRRHRPSDLVAVEEALHPTLGAENRYSTLLYIEKEGFGPLLRKARIAERFDCAVMSTKGMSVTAARLIVDRCAQQRVRILVAHDFDRAGAAIAHTLGNDTRRYSFEADPDVVDLGLSLFDASRLGLQDEEAPDAGPMAATLRAYGLGVEEIEFLIGQRRRVELNAMTSIQFVAWLEAKLARNGAGKVVPEADVLERHARRALARRLVTRGLSPLIARAEAEASKVVLPADLATLVGRALARDPELPWEDALVRTLPDVTPGAGS